MEDADHLRRFHPHDSARHHGGGSRQPQRLADQAAFPEKVSLAEKGDDGFLPLFGVDGDLDLALRNIKYRVRGVPRLENDLSNLVFGKRSTTIYGAELPTGVADPPWTKLWDSRGFFGPCGTCFV